MNSSLRLLAQIHTVCLARRGWLVLGVSALILAGLGSKSWRLYDQGRAVQADIQVIMEFAHTQPDITALPSIGVPLAKLRADSLALRAEAAPLLPLARRLGWVPRYGAELVAAEPLLDLLADLATAADESCAVLCPIAGERNGSEPLGMAITRRLAEGHPRLQAARGVLDRASATQNALQAGALSPWLHKNLEQLAIVLPQLREGLDVALAAPDLLGANGPRSYLLLAQDVNELRATGGFIGGAGLLTLDGGRVVDFSLGDSYDVDNLASHPYPAPPEPLRRYLGLQLWLFRDANWSPDFPTAARKAIDFYRIGQGRDVDGVIAFDETAMKLLLSATGSIEVAGAAVSADTVIEYMHEQYSLFFPARRKAFMRPLGQAIVARIEGHAADINWPAFGRTVRQAFDQRHTQVYIGEPTIAGLIARQGWDGAIRTGNNDFLMLVDSNLGYNKVNPNIVEAASYAIDLSDPRAPTAQLTVRHTNRQPGSGTCDWKKRGKVSHYEDYFVGCYWDYLRVLVPADAQLLKAQTHPTLGTWLFSGISEDGAADMTPSEGGANALSTFLVVPIGEARETAFRYQLPAGVLERDASGWHYRLTLQKQAGNEGISVDVHVRLPRAARFISASVTPVARSAQSIDFLFRLDQDQRLDVTFDTL